MRDCSRPCGRPETAQGIRVVRLFRPMCQSCVNMSTGPRRIPRGALEGKLELYFTCGRCRRASFASTRPSLCLDHWPDLDRWANRLRRRGDSGRFQDHAPLAVGQVRRAIVAIFSRCRHDNAAEGRGRNHAGRQVLRRRFPQATAATRTDQPNLAQSASFESLDKDAPSKAGTKHLARLIHDGGF